MFNRYTGFLDFAPRAVDGVKGGATVVKQKVGSLSSRIAGLGSSALNYTGVTSLVGSTLGLARWGASALIEQGKKEKIDCYSISCCPGQLCYSPTCPRNSSYSFLSSEAVQDIIKGVYSGTSSTFFQYSGPSEI